MFGTKALTLERGDSLRVNRTPFLLTTLLLTSLIGMGQDKLPRLTVTTELVQVSVSTLDREGRVATGLTKEDFEIFEDGVKQDITECMNEIAPVSTVLVLDKSRSMRSNLPLVVQGAFNVLDTHLKMDDEFLLVAFDGTPKLLFPQFTGDADTVKHVISAGLAEASGLTAFYDGLYLAVSNAKRKAKNPRRAAIVITDGGDTHSVYTKKEILGYLEEADVPVFAVNASEPNIFRTWSMGKNGKPEFITEDDAVGPVERGGPKVLKELTGATGGSVFTAHDPEDIPRIMGVVYDLISNQYTLFFKPHPDNGVPRLDGRHKIQVKLSARGNKFAGYHLYYKQQYYRSPDRGGATNTFAALPDR
jgi:Ca-activated chloride channel family protein